MIFKHDCEINGHRFRARYSNKLPESIGKVTANSPEFFEAMKSKLYHGDVCTRCGIVVNNPD